MEHDDGLFHRRSLTQEVAATEQAMERLTRVIEQNGENSHQLLLYTANLLYTYLSDHRKAQLQMVRYYEKKQGVKNPFRKRRTR